MSTNDLREQLQQTLGSSYCFERELGGGGMSRVFLAEDRLLGRDIVPVLSTGEANGLPYYTMPFVEGQSLRHRLATKQPLSINEVVNILRDVARALDYAHGRGVIHRDIKPENILLSGEAAVVTDFGIAKAIEDSRSPSPALPIMPHFRSSRAQRGIASFTSSSRAQRGIALHARQFNRLGWRAILSSLRSSG